MKRLKKSRRTLSRLLLLSLGLLLPSVSRCEISLGDRAIRIAFGYVGVVEHGYNRSPEIDYWNRKAGAPLASSWCEAFAYSMYDSAAKEAGVRNPFKRTASVSQQLRYAAYIGSGLTVIPIGKLLGGDMLAIHSGDMLCAKRGGGRERDIGYIWPGHTELAIGKSGSSKVRTIGGNTSPGTRGSQRDGDGVYERVRPITYFLAAIRTYAGGNPLPPENNIQR